MTNEFQLAKAAGLPANGQEIAYIPPRHQAAAKPMGLKKIHRLLRGRYPLVISLAILFGIGGAILGYRSQKPMFESVVKLEISPTIPSLRATDETVPSLNIIVTEQIALIESTEMIRDAMAEPEWQAINPAVTEQEIARFSNSLDAEAAPGTSLISITFSDPDRAVAFAGAKSMWEAYNQFYAQRDPFGLLDKQKLLESQIKDKSAQLDLLNSALVKIDSFGTDNLASFQVQEHQRYVDLEGLIATAKREVDLAEESAPAADKTPDSPRKPAGAKPASLTAEDIEKLGDPQMRQLLANQRAVETDLKSHQINGYGPNNPTIQIDENKLVVAKGEIGAYVETFNRDYRPMASQAGRPSELPIAANPAADLAGKRKRLELLTQQFEEQKSKLAGLATEIASATSLKQQINNLQGQLDTKNSQFEELRSRQILMKSQMSIVSMPSPASEPSYDKRRQLAAIGFVGGFIFPVCVALLIGLLDGRFRFSDETNSDLGGVPLLGILPNLPDLLSDPEQAATAAHCVHQIRTILQITGSEADRRAFAITSASPGDGKTSLCLALGLSFAASGSRTLLIDADLIGGGLTSRLNISQDHGVLEAMASRDILPYIRSTDVKDLSIIPVGMALGGYTGTIAPAAVRRLVNEAKRHFDVVVIDTGPILGSIEASPVAVAADGVVICVSRGQQRQLVDRAVSHLISIGAKLVGVVFNRAQGHDFEHSVSRMSMKQLPATNGNGKTGHSSRTNGERIGPVAKAVASSVRKEPAAGSEKKTA